MTPHTTLKPTVTITPVPQPPPQQVTLVMSREQAQDLRRVLEGHCSGPGRDTYKLMRALQDAGV